MGILVKWHRLPTEQVKECAYITINETSLRAVPYPRKRAHACTAGLPVQGVSSLHTHKGGRLVNAGQGWGGSSGPFLGSPGPQQLRLTVWEGHF